MSARLESIEAQVDKRLQARLKERTFRPVRLSEVVDRG